MCSYVKEGGGEKKSVVKLRGVGKYPHVVVRLPCGSRNRVQRRKGTQRSKKGRTPFVEGNLEELEESLIGVGSSRVEREVTVEFGSVAVGTSTQKWIELVNISAVSHLSYVCFADMHMYMYTHVCTIRSQQVCLYYLQTSLG